MPRTGPREEMLAELADVLAGVDRPHPTRVAIDGRPASGKTTLADELAGHLRARRRQVIRATIDEFLFPRAVRYRRGADSPEGCYEDSFDFAALRGALLDPLGPDGDRRFQIAGYDRAADVPLSLPRQSAAADAVLLFDGVFLLWPELDAHWDVRVLVLASFDATLERARARDLEGLGSVERVEERFRRRYGPSQDRYFTEVRPQDRAEILVDNEDPGRPAWRVRPTAGW